VLCCCWCGWVCAVLVGVVQMQNRCEKVNDEVAGNSSRQTLDPNKGPAILNQETVEAARPNKCIHDVFCPCKYYLSLIQSLWSPILDLCAVASSAAASCAFDQA
jgi:hypothetical protein